MAEPKFFLRFSSAASADLDDISAYSISQFGHGIAAHYLDGIQTACNLLTTFPKIAPFYPRLSPPTRCLHYRRHRIFYQTRDKDVLIVRILHHAQDIDRAMG